MYLNNKLLSLFAQKNRFGCDIKSMRLRYQALTNIYINLAITIAYFIYDTASWIIVNPPQTFQLTKTIIPIALLSLYFLRQGMIRASCIMGCLHISLSNLMACEMGREPAIGIYGLSVDLVISFFFAYSKHVIVIILGVYGALFTFHAIRILEIFAVTVNEEQSRQITGLIICATTSIILSFIALLVQKAMEIHLWETADINYKKTETLTKEVLKASEAKDIFVSSLSHEIRNPLNSLKGSIDYLYSTITCREHLKILDNAKLGCEILINLVTNVLDAAKLRADKMEISYSEYCFKNVIKKLLIINSQSLRSKNIHTKAYVDKSMPKMLWIDHARLLQIMMNLLSNALKFTPVEGKIQINVDWCPQDINAEELLRPKKVFLNNELQSLNPRPNISHTTYDSVGELSEFNEEESQRRQENLQIKYFNNRVFADLDNTIHHPSEYEPWTLYETPSYYSESNRQVINRGYLKIQLADTGCGIAPEHIPNLFKMFVQAHRSVNTMHGGTGLGLWICKQLCQRMGGDIKLYSEQNRGTCFVFYIPVDNSRTQEPLPLREGGFQYTPNVLIVDDYAHNRELHRLLVEREGARAILACDGNEAVRKFQAHPEGFFSFIMMDILMAPVDGFQAAKMIRQWEVQQRRTRKVDIYFVSGEYYNEYDVIAAFRTNNGDEDTAGMKCLKKPIDIDQLKETVRRYK